MTQDSGFPVQADLIAKLTIATAGETSNDQVIDVINAFLNALLVFASVEKAGEDGSVSPLMLQDSEGTPIMPLFTSPEIIPDDFREAAPHVSVVPGSAVIQSVADAGVVLDFGTERQFALSKEQIGAIRDEIITQIQDRETPKPPTA